MNGDGISVSNVSVFKYLGIHIDKNVNFNFHVDFLSKKISRAVGAFKHACKNIPFKTRTRCYAGTPRPETLPVTVWHYDFVNLELGHDLDLQIILIQVYPMIT